MRDPRSRRGRQILLLWARLRRLSLGHLIHAELPLGILQILAIHHNIPVLVPLREPQPLPLSIREARSAVRQGRVRLGLRQGDPRTASQQLTGRVTAIGNAVESRPASSLPIIPLRQLHDNKLSASHRSTKRDGVWDLTHELADVLRAINARRGLAAYANA